jgi:NAD(P)-dependent dehydrogenase (short-subunit alcohol dehydrogenase family)
MTTWFITGCSTGLGNHLAQAVLECGYNAVITARNTAQLSDLTTRFPNTAFPLALDLRNRTRALEVARQAEAHFGGIDVLVNNAGHGYRAAVEEGSDDEIQELFATNLFGPAALIRAVLPGMRKRRQGVIVNVSSIAGRHASAGTGYYAASKSAFGSISDSLRKEVEPLGIKVIVIEPGAFRTDFAGRSLQQSVTAIADYAETAGRRRKENDDTHGRQQGDPARGARAIIDIVKAASPPSRLLMGADAVRAIRSELQRQLAELEVWEAVSLSTDFSS